ncbi:serine/threonine protein kinase [Emydomyces testavorans]|uniref:non-specific serine/threonine protein kinase n=1 Tax=Emydomyces testavorans TaxID=2070801 RepID=A0AAF0DEU1_9EURO|nr:serine/threonine protein kinase [Emydomyces testavorans]
MANRASNAFLRYRNIRSFVLGLPCRQTQPMATCMKPSKVKYKFVEEVECLDYYVPGGYHPVMIGDELCMGRYVIAHKLGFGRSATTWLAEDRRQSRLVALKISTAESAERTQELQILLQLAKAKTRSKLPGKTIIQNLLDSFTLSGPNGTHQCLVMDAARISIHEAKDAAYHRLLHLPAARAIASQLILGLQFIHSQGIVHGGFNLNMAADLHLANILLHFPFDMTLEQLHVRTGKPAKEQVVREDSAPLDPEVPSEVIVPVWLGLGSDEISLTDSAIMIADFGEAFDPQVTPQCVSHTPLLLAPPESHFAEPLSFPGDIWTLACTIWDVFGSGPPFEAFPVTLDKVTIEHVEMLGKLPDRWWSKWEKRSNWFDEDGHKNVKEILHQWYGNSIRNWTQRFTDYIQHPRKRNRFDTFSVEEEKAFCDMIKSMLVFEPSKRATIEDVVECEWMQRWGLPEVQRMWKMTPKSS